MYEVGLDIRSQLRVFEQIDEVERKKRDARERDILMRAVRVSYFEPNIVVCWYDLTWWFEFVHVCVFLWLSYQCHLLIGS